LHDKVKILLRWKEYIDDLFDDNHPETPKMDNKEGPPISKSEVEYALHKMKNGKAAGEDQITAEMLEALNDFGIEKLTIIFNNIYETQVSFQMKCCLQYLSLFRKKSQCLRGLPNTEFNVAHYKPAVQEIIQKKIDREVGETQFGFRKESGTREGFFCLNTMM